MKYLEGRCLNKSRVGRLEGSDPVSKMVPGETMSLYVRGREVQVLQQKNYLKNYSRVYLGNSN